MWFGTKDGLNRFDGYNFKIFRHTIDDGKSIGNNIIRCIAEDKANNLYVGTEGGLYIMNMVDETFRRVDNITGDGFQISYTVNAIHLDSHGNIWIGTNSQGIFVYDTIRNELRKIKTNGFNFDSNIVWTIYADASGNIWAGTRLGLLNYNPNTDMLDPVESMYSFNDSSKHEIQTIFEDQKGSLWIGTWHEGLRFYQKQSNTYRTFLKSEKTSLAVTRIMAIFQYVDNILLIGSDNGLYIFNPDTEEYSRIDVPNMDYSLSDPGVYSIYKDREGGIWIGTYSGGINYLKPGRSFIETYNPNILSGTLSGKTVGQFCEDQHGNLWIATENGGVNYLDTKSKIISQPIKRAYYDVRSLMLDGENLWIGTYSKGIQIYNTKNKSFYTFEQDKGNGHGIHGDCIYALYKTKNGDIYAGTNTGLNKYNKDKDKNNFTHIPEVKTFVFDIKEDFQGNLWVATYGSGAIKYDIQSKEWIHYDAILPQSNPFVGSRLINIYIDSRKRLIFTSEGRGIFIYDYKTDSFTNISEKAGLPNSVIYGIQDDPQGNYWLSSNKGIIQINDIADIKTIRIYSKEDGLQSSQFNYKSSYKVQTGKLYFGGINGFSSFYPQDIDKNKNKILPPIEITQINILGNTDIEFSNEIQRKINEKQKIILPHNQSSFTISYISLSYPIQSKSQYAYKLEGVDEKWSYVGNNKNVTYLNLASGNYVFKVKGSNNDGVWNEEGTQIELEILPPFWLSITAKIIYILLIVLFIYLIISFVWKKNNKRQRQRLETFKTEQETLAFKSKIDFFTTIAHEIRTPLTLISAPLEEVINSEEGSPETKQNISIIEKNCNRLTELINQLLDFRKMDSTQYIVNPSKINLHTYMNELYYRFNKTAQNKNIDFILQLPKDECFVYTDKDGLTKIVGNLLVNALKYTKDKIVLSLNKSDEEIYSISVTDNGKGIADEHKKNIFDPFFQIQSDNKNGIGLGLSLAKNLAGKLNGSISVLDAGIEGSIFIFTFTDVAQTLLHHESDKKPEERETLFIKKESDKKSHILIVDDNSEMLQFLENSLKNEYILNTALDVNEAFPLLESNSYELIISDIMMPGIDGISFTKKLKSDINYNHIPIILLSAKTENAVKAEGLYSGAEVFIEKPFSVAHLKAQIVSILENRRAILETFNRSPFLSYSVLGANKDEQFFLNKLNEEIEKYISDENFSVESLANIFNISRSNLQKKLKSISGVPPGDYLRNYRLRRACKLLLETNMRINEVAYSVGFNTPSYFTQVFQKTYGMLPKEFISMHTHKSSQEEKDTIK
jgi:ligand-binding sensor domain-containing protein/signal transduction histidine kinase/DNA-binding response OmpR family regulator